MSNSKIETHSVAIGYLLWIFGFLGAHRFYYGRQLSGTIYFFTLGLLFIGWFVDLFLIPSLNSKADRRYSSGQIDYSIGWLLLTFTGLFGFHRMYMGKWVSGLIYLVTFGLVGIGYIYDLWTLNEQISSINNEQASYQTKS